LGHDLHDQHRRLVRVVVSHLDDVERPVREHDRVAVLNACGSTGEPSSPLSLEGSSGSALD
jgi:hypothetical protein